MTNGEQEIDRLRRRLGWESGGPLGQISTQATDTVVSILGSAVSWIRQSSEEHPLVSILLAFQAGFALGRWGGRHAQR
jgi:hypothetical protein